MISLFTKSIRYTLLAVLLLISGLSQAQQYVIIHVKGKITLVKTSSQIKRGDKIAGDEQIRFDSPDAIAAVLSSDRGRFILKPGENQKADNDLLYIFKSAVTPMRGRMSTRAGGINNALDFNKFFGAQFAFLGEDLLIKVSENAYPQNEANFFYIQYQFSGETINKKLGFSGDTLIINKTALLSVDGNAISESDASGYSLYYYNSTNQSSENVTEIDFNFITPSELKDMVTTMKEYEVEVDDDSIVALVFELYGRCQKDNVINALTDLE